MSPFDKDPSSRPQDPFELWRQIYDTNERAWSTILERTVNNPAFAESEDIARLGELIVALEEKVDQLDDRLSNIEATLRTQASAPPHAAERPASTPKRK